MNAEFTLPNRFSEVEKDLKSTFIRDTCMYILEALGITQREKEIRMGSGTCRGKLEKTRISNTIWGKDLGDHDQVRHVNILSHTGHVYNCSTSRSSSFSNNTSTCTYEENQKWQEVAHLKDKVDAWKGNDYKKDSFDFSFSSCTWQKVVPWFSELQTFIPLFSPSSLVLLCSLTIF